MSTDQLEQLSSYEAQVNYYTHYIEEHPDYEFAGIYADEGISGTNTKKREQFNRMIEDCKVGKIDMIITKSISRFARNTLDTLNYVRTLKELGVGVLFEKENINTLDSRGEVLLTILSSLAQDESRSISENSTWGIRRQFEQGKVRIATSTFLGYDADREGNLVINRKQAAIVQRIYTDFLNGIGTPTIARMLELENIENCKGKKKWHDSHIKSILTNEKYKGDAILQKSYTVDFLTKKRVENKGEVPKYYVEDSHEAIIDKETWGAAQLEMERRRSFAGEHHIRKQGSSFTGGPFAGKIICGTCGHAFTRKTWNSTDERLRRCIWQCKTKYEVKGVIRCTNKHIDNKLLDKSFINTFNAMIENKYYFINKWKRQLEEGDAFQKYKAKQFIELLDNAEQLTELDEKLLQILVEKMIVFENKMIIVKLLDETEIEVEIE